MIPISIQTPISVYKYHVFIYAPPQEAYIQTGSNARRQYNVRSSGHQNHQTDIKYNALRNAKTQKHQAVPKQYYANSVEQDLKSEPRARITAKYRIPYLSPPRKQDFCNGQNFRYFLAKQVIGSRCIPILRIRTTARYDQLTRGLSRFLFPRS